MTPSASSAPVALAPSTATARPRLDSIDLLRGLVMVIMALDHIREYFEFGETFPRDVHQPALFLTRWITHFCAPTFVFLAGMAAFLYGRRGRGNGPVSRFLWTRGLWLVFLELTVVRFGWSFRVTPDFVLLQVIWVMGFSMIALSALIYLPRPLLGGLALTLIVGHNLLDGFKAEAWGQFKWLWVLLHQPGFLQPASGIKVLAIYPLIPWLGVMMAGYFVGPVILCEGSRRRQILLRTGTALILIFIGLRASGLVW